MISSTIAMKSEILDRLCYTDLVYGRINKKLKINISNDVIEELMRRVIANTDEQDIQKIGKNYYISNSEHKIRITVNSFTFRIITADRM